MEELSTAVHASKAVQRGKEMCLRLKETIPQQLYEVAIQVKLPLISIIVVVLYLISNSKKAIVGSGNKIIARETVKAQRKDVTAKCVSSQLLNYYSDD